MAAQTIEDQIHKLTADLANLTRLVAAAGSDKAGAYQAKASRYASDTYDMSRDALEELRSEFGSIEKAVVNRVRAHPLQTIGVLGGLALLFALSSRR